MARVGVLGGDGTPTAMVDGVLATARMRLVRLEPRAVAAAIEQGAVLVDVRTSEQRREDGEIPGAVAISLNVLEWRADVTSPAHDVALGDAGTPLVVVCAEGYCSSLAAVRLLELGRQATDVVGGFAAWPVERVVIVRLEPVAAGRRVARRVHGSDVGLSRGDRACWNGSVHGDRRGRARHDRESHASR
jgi:rhodanese-related sulfurtransferase